MTISMTPRDDSVAKRNVAILVMAQAFLGAQMPMIFILGGLAGQSLASNACFATLPISLIVLGSMLSATPISAIMQKWGRRTGFIIGAFGGATGGLVGAYGLYLGSFPIFLVGSLLTGIYMSAQGFYRFAAADTASEGFRPKAISYVMAGGLLSAIIGPQLVKLTSQAFVVPFMGTYLTVIAINLVGALLFLFLDIPKPTPPSATSPRGRTRWELLKTPRIAVAVICAMVSYALMNLVMTSTPLAVVGCGFTQNNAADVVTMHVLAMYIPSFFTGHLISRFGVEKVVAAGLVILAGAGAVALNGVELGNFFGALILLGFGWNFGFIGATTMLAGAHEPHERGRMQGLNDLLVFGGVTFASLSSGGLMNCSGGNPVEGWNAVNMAMAPFLVLAGGALIWLTLRPRQDSYIGDKG
ncbi:MFS transporter [Parasedimentitalea psychrophila]|uniref:MFS transporter n=1 Tax=Parasedimentitalea psychrophila TaxID=2997337 RepID=A0A9Y2P0S9_9RHOB|nr:MFS transporter [Parasedimentitalea psychrophila]WIY24901.1 MFS transporter [Parasedimentitalea psychrophila]